MKFVISDEEEVRAAVRDILMEPYREHIKEWCDICRMEDSESADEFIRAMDALFVQTGTLQRQHRKAAVTFLNIHYLRASLLDGTFRLLLNAYSSRYYFDPMETDSDWCPKWIRQNYLSDMEYLEQQARKRNIRIPRMELQNIRQKHYMDYVLLLPGFCQMNVERVLALSSFSELEVDQEFGIVFGEYMGPIIPLYWRGGEEKRTDEILHA